MNRAKYSHSLSKRDFVYFIALHKCKLDTTLDGNVFTLSASTGWEVTRTSLCVMSSFLKYCRTDLS